MSQRLAILLGVALATILVSLAYTWIRSRAAPRSDRLDISALGLELMAGCCAFVVFTSPSCRSCKAALQVTREVAAGTKGPTEHVEIDAMAQTDVALACGVRAVPTIFLITASGHVLERWNRVPGMAEARSALTEPNLR